MALAASAYASLPAEKHPTHFVVYGIPTKQRSGTGSGSLPLLWSAVLRPWRATMAGWRHVGTGQPDRVGTPTPAPHLPLPCCLLRCSSLEQLDAELSAEVAALAGDGPTPDELRRYKKVGEAALCCCRCGTGDGQSRQCAREHSLASDQACTEACTDGVPGRGGQAGWPRLSCPEPPTLGCLQSARLELLGALSSNSTIASALSSYQVRTPCASRMPQGQSVDDCRLPLPSASFSPTPPSPLEQVLTGDWRNVLGDLRRIEALEAGEVRDAAARHLRPDNCFSGFVLPA